MKYLPINNEVFTVNRRNFVSRLKPCSLAIFNSNDEFPRSGDQAFLFKQNPDFFYLTGIDQEQSILLLFPECPNPLYKEVLFLRQTNEHIAVWEGHKYTIDEAKAASGIQTIYWLSEFDTILHSIINYAENIYINTNENDRYAHTVPYRDIRMLETLRSKYPLHKYERAALIMRDLRVVKSSIEVELTKKACQITRDAFLRVLKFVKPGVAEYEIEAEISHEFLRQRATGNAYSPIIASGKNAIVLHYVDNNAVCKDGEVILFDFGAEYANYNADMSRSVPVNGRFTKRQRDVYNAVLRVMRAATKMIVSGTVLNEYQEEVGKLMTDELIGLGLLDKHDVAKQDAKMPLYKKYFMHGTSHHLGLDVHDFASRYKAFEAGNILTCEPGIYIPAEGLGIRIENNILITESGNIDLMADIPVEADEIEEIMNG
ncbi:aminopeptidase P N-terminal domain-containing protein [Mucilaginibacter sp. L3T2-6]|uniref:aminopeptidase P N-terminal domain-containing protein n=1 Tax=Mucilaginibacter sp. L3T2-6 TaxID=3062491 RepID=UPI002675C4EF|nr:aminopeptidase P N-terminal domain-containing protein [Mucilaginibacter sp. L3T2-6]MDO3640672.1 aminopeptidase P N-terminal domain-containing protein [Mucilaginibacter sp. L3T2-6]MDV6212988.1 aminopeptidase P N-terminal domain-containing protein [Mucilaginibacter sp. L3T2-6]